MRRPALRVVLATLLLVTGVAGGVLAGAAPADARPGSVASAGALASESVDPSINTVGSEVNAIGSGASAVDPGTDPSQLATTNVTPETEFRIDLQSTREADWTVVVRYELTNDSETTAFERVAARFESGEVGPSADLYVNLAAGAAEASGREMEIMDVEREAAIDRGIEIAGEEGAVGELRLSFTWTEFLREEGDQLVLDDAFRTADGETWLQSLGTNQRMVIQPPEGYQVDSFPGIGLSLDDRAVVIEGPRTFEPDDDIVVVYTPTTQPVTGPPWLALAAAVIVGSIAIAGGLWAYRRTDESGPSIDVPIGNSGSNASTDGNDASETRGGSGAQAGGETGSGNGAGTEDAASTERTGTSEPSPGTDGTGTESAPEGVGASAERERTTGDSGVDGESDVGDGEETAGDEPDDSEKSAEPDPSLLSDEERVERLLEDSGGRMRQAAIVDETGWSDAKVSQLLSAMAEAGRVEKLRLGRENLISLPDHTPDEGGEGGPKGEDDPNGENDPNEEGSPSGEGRD